PEVLGLTDAVMPLVALGQPALAASLILMSALVNGAGQTRPSLLTALLCAVVLRAGVAYLLTGGLVHWGRTGAWGGVLTDYQGRALLNGKTFAAGGWRLHRR